MPGEMANTKPRTRELLNAADGRHTAVGSWSMPVFKLAFIYLKRCEMDFVQTRKQASHSCTAPVAKVDSCSEPFSQRACEASGERQRVPGSQRSGVVGDTI